MYIYFSDVDECQTNNGGCNQTCKNTYGSFECACSPGYTLAEDNLGCNGKSYSSFNMVLEPAVEGTVK